MQHFVYRENASQLHRAVGDCLGASVIFSGFVIEQEYPVSSVNPEFQGQAWFDWVIPQLKLIIECHGRQHYDIVDFSGTSQDGGMAAYRDLRRRDSEKKQAAIAAGWTYIEISYKDQKKITDDFIWQLYKAHLNTAQPPEEKETKRQSYLKSPEHQERLARARQLRKEHYNRTKALRSRRSKK